MYMYILYHVFPQMSSTAVGFLTHVKTIQNLWWWQCFGKFTSSSDLFGYRTHCRLTSRASAALSTASCKPRRPVKAALARWIMGSLGSDTARLARAGFLQLSTGRGSTKSGKFKVNQQIVESWHLLHNNMHNNMHWHWKSSSESFGPARNP